MRTMTFCALAITATALCSLSAASQAASSTVVGFDGGTDGGFGGNAYYVPNGGNPGGNAFFLLETFGIELRTGGDFDPTNPAFIGDYSGFASITFSVDVKVNSIAFFGSEVERVLGIKLMDHDIQGPDGASGVFFPLATISSATHGDWTTLSVTIDDPRQAALPDGWIGFGDYDPITFLPLLPDDATFATVLAGVDEFHLTTFEPGFFYGFTDFNVRVDNLAVSVTPIPLPGALLFFGSGLLVLLRRRR